MTSVDISPFIDHLPFGKRTGAFTTADESLVVYVLGPVRSRPFTMALHALIGAGFLAATFLVRPFLPSSEVIRSDKVPSSYRLIPGGHGGDLRLGVS